MSKAAKQCIIILIVLLLASMGLSLYLLLEKQKVETSKDRLNKELEETQEREKQWIVENKDLKEQVDLVAEEREEMNRLLAEANQQSESLQSQVAELQSQRQQLTSRVSEIEAERDELAKRMKQFDFTGSSNSSDSSASVQGKDNDGVVDEAERDLPDVAREQAEEAHWADVLKGKAELQVKLERLNELLSEKTVHIVELKEKNTELQIKIEGLQNAKDNIAREIKYKADLINTLSIELARAKNDRKFQEGRAERLDHENLNLRKKLKELVLAKGSLEKSVVKLTQDKNKVSKKLDHAESLIQNKIDEIDSIQSSLDGSLRSYDHSGSTEVELPPIVIKSDNAPPARKRPVSGAALNGEVLSVNNENNFIIVNLGQKENIRIGDQLSVYRESKYIARLEVIQVRSDISAADIKEQWSPVEVGDLVR